MWYKYATTVGLALALLGLASTVVYAEEGSKPTSIGVVATIIALDAKTGVATLQTDWGEVFELPQRPPWHVGHQVLCNRLTMTARPQLQGCQLWEEKHSPAPRAGRFADTELPRTTPKGWFQTTD